MLCFSVLLPLRRICEAVYFRARAFLVLVFWVLGGFGVAHVFCPFECIVRLSLKCSLGACVEPVRQFLNVEIWFPMLAEGSTLGISFLFCLESLWRRAVLIRQ